MRYRENGSEPVGATIDDRMVSGTAAYALLAGLLLCAIGLRSRKYWLLSMGALLVCSSSSYLVWRMFAG